MAWWWWWRKSSAGLRQAGAEVEMEEVDSRVKRRGLDEAGAPAPSLYRAWGVQICLLSKSYLFI